METEDDVSERTPAAKQHVETTLGRQRKYYSYYSSVRSQVAPQDLWDILRYGKNSEDES